uniref:Rad60/SUMO-like domain-containing protein n=1 Tax=Eutreptiella gymnastica TaxID=73025 RepID=A0A7S1NNU3_9EUGL
MVLHFLRTGVALLPQDIEGRRAVLREARYYNLEGLALVSRPPDPERRIGLQVDPADPDSYIYPTFFRLKISTPLRKLMKAFCTKHVLPPTLACFFFHGHRLDGDKTAAHYGMEDDDVIEFKLN